MGQVNFENGRSKYEVIMEVQCTNTLLKVPSVYSDFVINILHHHT